jgi:hypothetical protein
MSATAADYRRHQHEFAARAEQCAGEIAALWREVATSYRFLADREERIERGRDNGINWQR